MSPFPNCSVSDSLPLLEGSASVFSVVVVVELLLPPPQAARNAAREVPPPTAMNLRRETASNFGMVRLLLVYASSRPLRTYVMKRITKKPEGGGGVSCDL